MSDDRRAQFEKWAAINGYAIGRNGDYAYSDTQRAWWAWQAGRDNGHNAGLEAAAQLAEKEPRVWDTDAPDPQHRIAAKIRGIKREP